MTQHQRGILIRLGLIRVQHHAALKELKIAGLLEINGTQHTWVVYVGVGYVLCKSMV